MSQLHLYAGFPVLCELDVGEVVRQAELSPDSVHVLRERGAAQQVDLTVGEPRLDPLLQQLQNILHGKMSFIKSNLSTRFISNCLEGGEAHQSAGDADHSDGSLGGLGDVKQVVEERLVLVVGEQVKLIQDEQHGAAAAAIT